MTILDDIIDASTDSTVSTPDLLRKVQIAAHRLGATEVVAWVKQELNGYDYDAALPSYRKAATNVIGTFSGPMRSFPKEQLTVVPDGMESLWTVELREPLIELVALSDGDRDPSRAWHAAAVRKYEESGAMRLSLHILYSAENVISRQSLLGIVDIVRSKALEFALELQDVDPDAGSLDGPKASEPGVERALHHVTYNIYGDGANVATGSDIHQRSRVQKGDAAALRREAEVHGLTAEIAEEFVAAVQAERSLDGTKTKRILDGVRNGAIALSGSIASDAAAGGLVEIVKGFLGLQ